MKQKNLLKKYLKYESSHFEGSVEEWNDLMVSEETERESTEQIVDLLSIPGLHEVIGLIGDVEVSGVYKGKKCKVKLCNVEKLEYTKVVIIYDKTIVSTYAVGMYGEVFDFSVIRQGKENLEEKLIRVVFKDTKKAAEILEHLIEDILEVIMSEIDKKLA